MHASYKLIGAHWDGLPQTEELPLSIPFESGMLLFGAPRTLFDIVCCRRAASLSHLFSCASLDEVDAYILLGEDCDEVVLLVDVRPRASGTVPNEFFKKRLRQVLYRVKTVLPEAEIMLMNGVDSDEAALCGRTVA